MNEGARAFLAVIVAAVVAGLVMALDEPIIGCNLFWGWPVLIGVVVALVLVYGAVLFFLWGE